MSSALILILTVASPCHTAIANFPAKGDSISTGWCSSQRRVEGGLVPVEITYRSFPWCTLRAAEVHMNCLPRQSRATASFGPLGRSAHAL